jgi:hypothetical protein
MSERDLTRLIGALAMLSRRDRTRKRRRHAQRLIEDLELLREAQRFVAAEDALAAAEGRPAPILA